MLKITSWHVWAAAAIGIAAVLTTIFDPSALILITLFFVLCVYIVVRIKKGKFTS
jgi:flagellar biogenesis protein FliO